MQGPQAISLWQASAAEDDVAAPLPSSCDTDVAIVGGGYTGLSTALHCAEAGLAAHVLEAEQVGHGGSGRNAGLVNAGMWLPPQDVCAKLGAERGDRIVRALGEAPAYVMSLIERHQIRCEATRTGTIHAAHAASGLADLRRRREAWHRLGAPVDLLDAEAVAAMTGSRAYVGGLLDHRAGTINPMGYARGLARVARAAGATISTGVRVERLQREGDRWRLVTGQGTVTANRVILATNAYTDSLWPGLSRVFYTIRYFQVATEPLGDRIAAILPDGQGLWDTAPIMTSIRRDTFGRLIVGSMGQAMGRLSTRWAARRLARLFPSLGPVRFADAWHGEIAMTPDHLPRIFRLAEGLYTPIGYNGRGITTGTIFGRAMAELLAGGREADLPLPLGAPVPVRGRALRQGFYRAVFAANQALGAI